MKFKKFQKLFLWEGGWTGRILLRNRSSNDSSFTTRARTGGHRIIFDWFGPQRDLAVRVYKCTLSATDGLKFPMPPAERITRNRLTKARQNFRILLRFGFLPWCCCAGRPVRPHLPCNLHRILHAFFLRATLSASPAASRPPRGVRARFRSVQQQPTNPSPSGARAPGLRLASLWR